MRIKMKKTLSDAIASLTPRNCIIFAVIVALSGLSISVFGIVVWKRFVLPSLVGSLAFVGWEIGREIAGKQTGLSKLINAGSTGTAVFAVFLLLGAFADTLFIPDPGYALFGVLSLMLLWFNFHAIKAKRIVHKLTPEDKIVVTDGAAVIYAKMTRLQKEIGETLHDNDVQMKKLPKHLRQVHLVH